MAWYTGDVFYDTALLAGFAYLLMFCFKPKLPGRDVCPGSVLPSLPGHWLASSFSWLLWRTWCLAH